MDFLPNILYYREDNIASSFPFFHVIFFPTTMMLLFPFPNLKLFPTHLPTLPLPQGREEKMDLLYTPAWITQFLMWSCSHTMQKLEEQTKIMVQQIKIFILIRLYSVKKGKNARKTEILWLKSNIHIVYELCASKNIHCKRARKKKRKKHFADF